MDSFEDNLEAPKSEDTSDPWSESYAVQRVTSDREEVHDLLKTMANDPRVVKFLAEYDSKYDQLVVSNDHRLTLRTKVRSMKAKRGVSCAKSEAVDNIHRVTDEHVSDLRREVNVVFHQLIEVQEDEDRCKADISELSTSIKNLNTKIRERELDIHGNQTNLQKRLEEKLLQLQADRDKVGARVETLKEQFWDYTAQQANLESNRLRVEDKIAETKDDFIRVNNDINREQLKKAKLKAAYEAATEQLAQRRQDIEDITLHLETAREQCKQHAEDARLSNINMEKVLMELQAMSAKCRGRQFEYETEMEELQQMEMDVNATATEYKRKKQEVDAIKDQVAHIERTRKIIRQKIEDIERKKKKIIKTKEEEKKRNTAMLNEIADRKRRNEMFLKGQAMLQKQRDFIRKNLMKEKSTMEKDHVLLTLHVLANRRLLQDNQNLEAEGREQKVLMKKLDVDRNGYIKQAIGMHKNLLISTDKQRKAMDTVFQLMRRIAEEEMKMLENQNLYEATRNEHVLFTRHILQLKDLITHLKTKSRSLSYEALKLVQERDYRDDCLVREALALQKLNRHIFVLKVNLKDLKESNTRTKMILENQDLEEKKLLKMTRVMEKEKTREFKGLERVIRDIDGLDLALTRRHHELHDLYKMVKLKQSLLEKGENMYNIRWKEHQKITSNLRQTKAQRRLDQKNRNIVNRLLDCVKFFHGQLERVQLRSKGLMEELSHPRNIHRWRNLLGRDPEAYQSVRNLHRVRRQIQEKVAATTRVTTDIQLLDREYIHLTSRLLMQPSPETVLQLKLYKEDLGNRYIQIKTLTVQLRECLDDKLDMAARQQVIQRKLGEIRALWISHCSKDKKRMVQQTLLAAPPLSLLSGPQGLASLTGTKPAPSPPATAHVYRTPGGRATQLTPVPSSDVIIP